MEVFTIGFVTVTWVDILDILLVTFLFYRLYIAMRGTIAAQVFLGLVLVIVGSIIARAVDMKALSWILKTLTDIWVIALIVLFQPELRRLLLYLGRNPIVKFFIRTDVKEYADIIIRAFEELRQRHEGALIIIIRTTDIKLFVDTGLPIHAHISKELLVTIFNKRSPLHDGAVIIKDRYIEAARCTLPLSGVESIGEKMLGTRHRAALGISEQADVVALVLSEETGEFAFAKSGKLSLNLSSEELREKIANAITGPIVIPPADMHLTGTSKDYALESREGIDR
ncbi:MAG: diadenylate cyclase CdaA [Bacteroidota bacterium]|nr:diadenylate cyclase CdaA [Bacteroidota bacterium]MDP4229837.1 diadenylate cyclase CdaA [Bacteroidota bacterium]MDP4236182.1 diadenylate cyclase CdaA [Bacteroidota bacterium]